MTRSLLAAACFVCVALPAHALDVRAVVTEAAHAVGVPVALAQAVAHVETRHRCHLVGKALERGPLQIKPQTAKGLGYRGAATGLSDCRTGATWGMRYLKLALDRAGGNWMVAATKYNAGVYSPRSASGYGRKVLAFAYSPNGLDAGR